MGGTPMNATTSTNTNGTTEAEKTSFADKAHVQLDDAHRCWHWLLSNVPHSRVTFMRNKLLKCSHYSKK